MEILRLSKWMIRKMKGIPQLQAKNDQQKM